MEAQVNYVKWVLNVGRNIVGLKVTVAWGRARVLQAHQSMWWKNVTIPLIQLCTVLPAAAGLDTIQTMITIATMMPRSRCNTVSRLQALPGRRQARGRARMFGGRPETQQARPWYSQSIVTTAEQINPFPTRILPNLG